MKGLIALLILFSVVIAVSGCAQESWSAGNGDEGRCINL